MNERDREKKVAKTEKTRTGDTHIGIYCSGAIKGCISERAGRKNRQQRGVLLVLFARIP